MIELRGLKSGGDLIEILVAGGHARDHLFTLIKLVDRFERVSNHVADSDKRSFDFLFGDIEDDFFRAIEKFFDAALLLVTPRRNFSCGADQAAKNGLFAHDAGVIRNIRGGGDEIGQGRQISGAADRFQFVFAF